MINEPLVHSQGDNEADVWKYAARNTLNSKWSQFMNFSISGSFGEAVFIICKASNAIFISASATCGDLIYLKVDASFINDDNL